MMKRKRKLKPKISDFGFGIIVLATLIILISSILIIFGGVVEDSDGTRGIGYTILCPLLIALGVISIFIVIMNGIKRTKRENEPENSKKHLDD